MTLGRRSMPCLVAAAALLVLLGSANGASAGEETAALDRAIGHYWDGLFSEAVAALEPLAESLEGEEEILAREYLARSLVRLGEEDRGRAAFKALLRIRPDWRPDAKVVAGPEMSAFEAALEQYENENLGALNVRTGPSTGDSALGQVLRGQRYAALSSSGDWRRLQFDARSAWSHGGYLQQVSLAP